MPDNSNKTEFDVIVYGTVCLDMLWRVPQLPPLGGYVETQDERRMIGGEASNTAIALAKWGVRVALVGSALGDDADGDAMREMFRRDAPEIDTRFIGTIPGLRTPFCVCLATPDGQRTMFGTGGDALICPPLPVALARAAQWFTTDPNPWQSSLDAIAVAHEAGCAVVPMDMTRVPEITHIARINLTSHAADETGSYAGYAEKLRDESGQTTIVTCGEDGCRVAEAGRTGEPAVSVPAYHAPEVVDTTGAGDVFRAGLLFGQLQNWDILTTARFASAAAALNCTALGGWGGVRSLPETLAFQEAANYTNSV